MFLFSFSLTKNNFLLYNLVSLLTQISEIHAIQAGGLFFLLSHLQVIAKDKFPIAM